MKKSGWILFLWLFPLIVRAQGLYFPPTTGSTWETISPASLNWCSAKVDSLYDFLDTNNTKAFILLKDGKIVLEQYFGSHTQNSLWYWASAGKTITSFMVGMAQEENHLSITDTTSHYLGPGWTNASPAQEEKITIWHQLTMTSGLDDAVPDHFCTLDTCLLYKADPGTRWAYHNGPYTLLDKVIENATGMSLNTYTTLKLKEPTGMTGSFVPVEYNNVFFSNARSMARFGLLILNRGVWGETPVMTDEDYFEQMVNTSQALNESYGYLWWLNGKSSFRMPQTQWVFDGFLNPNAPADMIVALGMNGQFLNVVPGQNIVWLRMGASPDNSNVPYLLNDQIWQHINALECSVLGIRTDTEEGMSVEIAPNPGQDQITVRSAREFSGIEIIDLQGRLLKTVPATSGEQVVSVGDLPSGFFYMKIEFPGGGSSIRKWIKE